MPYWCDNVMWLIWALKNSSFAGANKMGGRAGGQRSDLSPRLPTGSWKCDACQHSHLQTKSFPCQAHWLWLNLPQWNLCPPPHLQRSIHSSRVVSNWGCWRFLYWNLPWLLGPWGAHHQLSHRQQALEHQRCQWPWVCCLQELAESKVYQSAQAIQKVHCPPPSSGPPPAGTSGLVPLPSKRSLQIPWGWLADQVSWEKRQPWFWLITCSSSKLTLARLEQRCAKGPSTPETRVCGLWETASRTSFQSTQILCWVAALQFSQHVHEAPPQESCLAPFLFFLIFIFILHLAQLLIINFFIQYIHQLLLCVVEEEADKHHSCMKLIGDNPVCPSFTFLTSQSGLQSDFLSLA